VHHELHVIRRITAVITRPRSRSTIGAPSETPTALTTTPSERSPSTRLVHNVGDALRHAVARPDDRIVDEAVRMMTLRHAIVITRS
jgi:hypothetical protein